MRQPHLPAAALTFIAVLLFTSCDTPASELAPTAAPSPTYQPTAIVTVTSTLTPTSTPTPTHTPTATPIPSSNFPVIDIDNIAQIKQIDTFETKIENAYYFDTKGNYVALGGGIYNNAELWNMQSRSLIRKFATDEYGIFHPTRDILAVASPRSTEPTISLQEIETGSEVAVLGGYSHDAYEAVWTDLAFSPDGRYLAASIATAQKSGDESFPIMIWDTDTGKKVTAITTPYALSFSPVFSPDGSKLVYIHEGAVNESRPTLVMLKFPSLTPMWELRVNIIQRTADCITCIVYAPDGKTLAVVTASQILVVDARKGTVVHKLDATGGAAGAVYTSDSEAIVGLIGGGNVLRVYDLETGQAITTVSGVGPRALGMSVLDEGRTIVVWKRTSYNSSSGYTKFEASWYRAAP